MNIFLWWSVWTICDVELIKFHPVSELSVLCLVLLAHCALRLAKRVRDSRHLRSSDRLGGRVSQLASAPRVGEHESYNAWYENSSAKQKINHVILEDQAEHV